MKQFDVAIFSLGNLLCYVPLYLMTRMASEGRFAALNGVGVSSFEILPLYVIGDVLVVGLFLLLAGWLRHVPRFEFFGIKLPKLRWYIVVSGLCTIAQITTAIWAYAFQGVSLVLIALLMKGGVLLLAPAVDLLIKSRKRKIYWPSWMAASLSLFALVISFAEKADVAISIACSIDIGIYLFSYFVKLSIMSRWAKTINSLERKTYIAEEQIVISLGLIIFVAVMATIGAFWKNGSVYEQVWRGVSYLPSMGFVLEPIFIGASAAGVGIFGSLVFLDRRENTFCIAAIQSTSIIAGTVASLLMAHFFSARPLTPAKFVSVCIVLIAIAFLVLRRSSEKRMITPSEGSQNRAGYVRTFPPLAGKIL